METTSLGAGVFTIRHFLNTEECRRYIALSEQIGFSEAAVTTDDGDRLLKDARNNDRILLDRPELADELFAKARGHLPQVIDGWRLCGFNERMRFYRYHGQQYFKWHQDGTFRRSEQQERGREEISHQSTWTFYWKGQLLVVELENVSTIGPVDGHRHGHKRVRSLEIPHHLRGDRDAILSDLKEALIAYKTGGVFSSAASYSLTLDV